MVRCAAIARNVAAWDALSDEDASYDPVIAALDRATRAIVNADMSDPQAVNAALDLVDNALDMLKALLENA